jgi:hypothetical protein
VHKEKDVHEPAGRSTSANEAVFIGERVSLAVTASCRVKTKVSHRIHSRPGGIYRPIFGSHFFNDPKVSDEDVRHSQSLFRDHQIYDCKVKVLPE